MTRERAREGVSGGCSSQGVWARSLHWRGKFPSNLGLACLLVQDRPQNGDDKMSEMRCSFIELQPANDAVFGKIFCYTRFGDAQMFSEPRFDGFLIAAARPAAQEIANGDAQSLTRLDIVVGGQVRVCQEENAGSDGSKVRFVELHRRAGEQAAELHFKK